MNHAQRRIDYLRISVTDMCNLRCIYCRPWKEIGKKGHQEILRYEEIVRLGSLMVQCGIILNAGIICDFVSSQQLRAIWL
ncbi:MAG: hypothetical protein QME81_12330 [bacterium]|nr:hypothetical protein [bacterium]